MAGPIRALPADHESKARLLKLKMLPAALYGVETSFVADTGLRRLRGAVFSVLKPRCSLGGNAAHLFTETATRGNELDPELLIAHRRLMALDRAWRSDLRLVGSATMILAAYRRAGYYGQEQNAQQDSKPIPPPGWPGRAGWRKPFPARGPIGYLLQSLRAYGLSLAEGEEGPELRQIEEIPVPLATGPLRQMGTAC